MNGVGEQIGGGLGLGLQTGPTAEGQELTVMCTAHVTKLRLWRATTDAPGLRRTVASSISSNAPYQAEELQLPPPTPPQEALPARLPRRPPSPCKLAQGQLSRHGCDCGPWHVRGSLPQETGMQGNDIQAAL